MSGELPSTWRWAARGLLAGYWLALAIGTHLPPSPDDGGAINDKVLHFAAYAGLAGLFVLGGGPLVRPWWRAVLLAAAFGIADELTQPFFSREADLTDWFADLSGAASGAFLGHLVRSQFEVRDAT